MSEKTDEAAELTAARVVQAVDMYLMDPTFNPQEVFTDPEKLRRWILGVAIVSVHAATPIVWQASADTIIEVLTSGVTDPELQTTKEAAAEVGRWISTWERTDTKTFDV